MTKRSAALSVAGRRCLIALLPGLFAPDAVAVVGAPGKDALTIERRTPAASVTVEATFTATEQNLIMQYFQQHKVGSKRLPPGIAKNLARGKPLPPGIAKRFLPQDLETTLPARSGYERVIAGSDVLLIDAATQVVTDILRAVVH